MGHINATVLYHIPSLRQLFVDSVVADVPLANTIGSKFIVYHLDVVFFFIVSSSVEPNHLSKLGTIFCEVLKKKNWGQREIMLD